MVQMGDEEEFDDEERRSDMTDEQLNDSDEMDEEDNFDFLLKRQNEKNSRITEDIDHNTVHSLEVSSQSQAQRASTVYVKK